MNPVTILLVEDNPDHALLIQRGLQSSNILNQITVVKDGQEALDYLYGQGLYADAALAPRPGLILLDIKLPKISGLDVLQRIKQDVALKSIPVVMLTSSEQEADMKKSYDAGANSYITKPMQFTEFIEKIRQVELYWVLVNNLPPLSSVSIG